MQSSKIKFLDATIVASGKGYANRETLDGRYPYFTCAKFPTKIDTFSFDCDAIIVAGNNANANFHINRYSGKFDASQRTYIFTAKESFDIDYLRYSLEFQSYILKNKSVGTQTKYITIDAFNFEINQIPKHLQEKLIKPLKDIDNKIEINKKINDNLYYYSIVA